MKRRVSSIKVWSRVKYSDLRKGGSYVLTNPLLAKRKNINSVDCYVVGRDSDLQMSDQNVWIVGNDMQEMEWNLVIEKPSINTNPLSLIPPSIGMSLINSKDSSWF